MADTRVFDVDKNLIWAGFLYGDLLVLDGAAGLFNDLCPLLLRNAAHGDGGGGLVWN